MSAEFESPTRLSVRWPGVTRIFARVRIAAPTDTESMTSQLRSDIEEGYSVSDIEKPDENQSRRPLSDGEDSETETLSGEPEPP